MDKSEEGLSNTNSTRSGLARQLTASMIVAALSLNAGMVRGWLSPMSLKLKSKGSPVEILSKDEISTLASIPHYSCLVLAFTLSYVASRYGRKTALILEGVMNIVSGAILTFAPTKRWLYFGRVFAKFSIIGVSMPGTYISETVNESIRGMMTSSCFVAKNVGILLSYVFGKILSYKAYNLLLTGVPVIYTILLFWLPESPAFLVEQGRVERAKKSLLWFRGGDERQVELELEDMSSSNTNDASEDGKNSKFVDIMKDPVTRAALVINICIYTLQTLSGMQAVLNYSSIIFEEAGSPLGPRDSSIIIASLLVVTSLLNLTLIDKFGRKPLLYLSFAGCSVSLSILSAFLYVHKKGHVADGSGWLQICCLEVFAVSYGIGLAVVPGILSNEVTPTKISGPMSAVSNVVVMFVVIAVLQSFLFLDATMGLYSAFVIPSISSFVGVLFTWLVVPETRGKSLTQITNELSGSQKNKVIE